jgi:hypothetical protein
VTLRDLADVLIARAAEADDDARDRAAAQGARVGAADDTRDDAAACLFHSEEARALAAEGETTYAKVNSGSSERVCAAAPTTPPGGVGPLSTASSSPPPRPAAARRPPAAIVSHREVEDSGNQIF